MVMSFLETPVTFGVVLFIILVAIMEAGRRIGRRRMARDAGVLEAGTGAVDGVVFAMLGLLVAFTFSSAASRFDERRAMIVTEANDIGTAYLRIDLLPDTAQPALRDAFHRYVGSRVATFQGNPSPESFNEALARSKDIQAEIWKLAVAASRQPDAPPAANMLLLPAINAMIDITTTRAAAMQVHPPWPIFFMLLVTALVCALLGGHAMLRSRAPNWFHVIGFAAIVTLTLYVIADLEYPRLGQIQVGSMDQLLEESVK
ncbi:hypothetical protein [Aestuariivirga sp.]|uniref:bestrophin-like domain n=1 Tax=Aestuariivirga sp. TaxID=2650926 RepID=UPI0035AF95DD